MIIDSKGRLFGKINLIDLLIIVFLVILAGGITYYFKSKIKASFSKLENIEIVFYSDESPDFAANSVVPTSGVKVMDPIKNIEFGNLQDIKIDESKVTAMTAEGKFLIAPKPGYKSVIINVSGKGVMTENGVLIGNSPYFVGKTTEIRVGNTAFWTRIYSIKKKE